MTDDEKKIIDEGGSDSDEEDEDVSQAGGNPSDTGSASDASTGTSGAGKKKKKKKNKKKKKSASESSQASDQQASSTSSTSNAPKLSKAEAEKKFQKALGAIKDEDLWVDLNSSGLSDTKLKKLLDELKKSDSVTSLNLSQNQLSDEAAQALAAGLASTSVLPGLITLDVRENSFTDAGLTVMEGLKKVRRNLDIMTGAMTQPVPEETEEDLNKDDFKKKLGKNLADNKLVRKYFQMGNDDDDDDANDIPLPPTIEPGELWSRIEASVKQGTSSIPELSVSLKQACQQIASEVQDLEASNKTYTESTVAAPHVKAALEHLHTLEAILNMAPQPVTVQYSKEKQAAIGSHRVFTTQVIYHLLSLHSKLADQLIAASKVVPRMYHLVLLHPTCSAIQERALRILSAAIVSEVDDLLGPILVLPGWGAALPRPATLPKGDSTEELCPPLQSVVASLGQAAHGVRPGVRSPLIGFAISAAKFFQAAHHNEPMPTLNESSTSDINGSSQLPAYNQTVVKALTTNSQWSDYLDGFAGVYTELIKEQEGILGGVPPPPKPDPSTDTEGLELPGGNLLSGQEILALLHGMSLK